MALQWQILGAGAIGQLLACKLSRVGIPARLLCRSRVQAARIAQGIELQENARTQRYAIDAGWIGEATPIAALFVTTKSNQAVPAFEQAWPLLKSDAPVVLLHNGMGIYEQLLRNHPGVDLYAGSTTEAAYREGPARLVHAGRGETRIGKPGGGCAPGWFSDFANSGESFIWEADIELQLWRKLLVNCAINPLTAIHRCRNGELLRNPEYREQLEQLCAELAGVCRARGEEELAGELPDMAKGVIRSTAENQSSMLTDVLNAQPTEIEHITGYLCREARRLNVSCPLNERLLRALR